jgi:hypothetical protein
MEIVDCADQTSFWPFLLFVIGNAVTTILIARRNGFGLRDTGLAMIGRRSFQRTGLINLCQAVSLTLPLGLWVWSIMGCTSG